MVGTVVSCVANLTGLKKKMSDEPELPQLYSMDRQNMLRVMNILWDWCMIHEGGCGVTYNAPNGILSRGCSEWYRKNADRVGLDII